MGLAHMDLCPTGSLRCLILQLRSQHSKGKVLIIINVFLGETTPKKQSLIENFLPFFFNRSICSSMLTKFPPN